MSARSRSRSPGPRYAALLQLLRTADTLWNSSRLFFEQWKLSPSQFNVLNLLQQQPDGISQVGLSRKLIMHRSNVTGLVDRLEQRGLVQRRAAPEDRRVYKVVLTAGGKRLVEEVLPHFYRAAEQVWGEFPVRRAEQLMKDLERLSANAQRMAKPVVKR